MKLQIFKAILKKGEVVSLESIHKDQCHTDLGIDPINKSGITWFRVLIDSDRYYNEEMRKKQAQREFDLFMNLPRLP